MGTPTHFLLLVNCRKQMPHLPFTVSFQRGLSLFCVKQLHEDGEYLLISPPASYENIYQHTHTGRWELMTHFSSHEVKYGSVCYRADGAKSRWRSTLTCILFKVRGQSINLRVCFIIPMMVGEEGARLQHLQYIFFCSIIVRFSYLECHVN